MRLYETVIVFDPQLKTTEIEEHFKKFTDFITNHGGEIVKQDDWGKRRLAYEINRKQYGYYILMRFNAPGQVILLLEREFKLNEMVIRYLTIKVDKKELKMEQRLERKAAEEKSDAQDAAAEKQPEQDTKPEPEPGSEPEPEEEPVAEPEPEPEPAAEPELDVEASAEGEETGETAVTDEEKGSE